MREPLALHFPPCGVAALESHHAADFRMPMEAAPFTKIFHPLRGRGRLLLGNRSEKLDSRAVAVVPPGAAHAISDDPASALVLMIVCIRGDAIPQSLSPGLIPSGAVVCRRPVVLQECRRLLRALFVEQSLPAPNKGALLVVRALELLALFEKTAPALRKTPAPARGATRARVAAWLQGGSATLQESIDEAAARLEISRRAFTAAVREVTGESWLKGRRARSILHARYLLEHTPRSITSIAFECGFEDLSSFYRNFRKHSGTSPGAWRASKPRRRAGGAAEPAGLSGNLTTTKRR